MEDVDIIFEKLIYNGVEYLKRFSSTEKSSTQLLIEASKLFSSAIKVNKKRPESYFYLAYIFYLYKEKNLALKYLNILEKVSPEFPNIDILVSLIKNLNKISEINTSNFLTKENYNYKTIEYLNEQKR
ncbi:MAG: hypothetical protein ACK4IX_12980 [Candidatus Sericytochromatia bacterium]